MKGLFIPEITAEMFRNGCLESIEALMAEGEIYDIDYDPEPHWIPVTERLPEDDTEVIVSCTDDDGDSEFSYTTTGWCYGRIWIVGNERSYCVRAWMPLPKAWRGEPK